MKKHMKAALLCGILGCLCYGGGDWLMMFGNPTYQGTLSWLTEGVAAIEKHHEERYRRLLANIERNEVWQRIGENRWQCRNCGHIYVGAKAPDVCPVCDHPRAHFQIEPQNY